MSIDRREKTIQVSGKQMLIKEIDLDSMYIYAEKIIGLFTTAEEKPESNGKKTLPLQNFHALLVEAGPVLTDWTGQEIMKLTPSQIKQLLPFFKEVNEDFLGILESFGIMERFQLIKETMKSEQRRDILKLEREKLSGQN